MTDDTPARPSADSGTASPQPASASQPPPQAARLQALRAEKTGDGTPDVADLVAANENLASRLRYLEAALRAAGGAFSIIRRDGDYGGDWPAGAALETSVADPADGDQVAELERTVRELRADLEHLRRELASEVRTRRVVVVEPDGFERVVVGGVDLLPRNAGVHVYARPQGRPADDDNRSHVCLWACEDEAWVGQESVGLSLWGPATTTAPSRCSAQIRRAMRTSTRTCENAGRRSSPSARRPAPGGSSSTTRERGSLRSDSTRSAPPRPRCTSASW